MEFDFCALINYLQCVVKYHNQTGKNLDANISIFFPTHLNINFNSSYLETNNS